MWRHFDSRKRIAYTGEATGLQRGEGRAPLSTLHVQNSPYVGTLQAQMFMVLRSGSLGLGTSVQLGTDLSPCSWGACILMGKTDNKQTDT